MNLDQLPPKALQLLEHVRVNAPARMLNEGLLEKIIQWRVHPEVGIDYITLENISRERLNEMAKRIREAGLRPTVHGPFMDLAPGAVDPAIRQTSRKRLLQGLETAAIFEPVQMVFHANFDVFRYGDDAEQWLETSQETWIPLARRAAEFGFRLVLENVYERGPEELLPLLDALSAEGVGFCLDPGHAKTFGHATVIHWLEVLHQHLAEMHLHDNHGQGDEHLPIGHGDIDFAGAFQWLRDHAVQPRIVTLEPHKEQDLWPSLAALAELWPWPEA
jgi:sugar phosphate isomerase/epimerase